MANGIIETDGDIATGVRALRRKCSVMRAVHDLAGPPPLRRRAAGLEGLARIVVGQQLSVASAGAIWGRFETMISPLTAERMVLASEAELKAVGLSGGKIRTLRAIAAAVLAGELDISVLATASDEHVRERLVAVHGIGPWTADIFAMFCLGRRDAFAPGDLALQVAAQRAFALDERPSAKELDALAERWRPWRGVAARLLWSYYAVTRPGSGQGTPAVPV